MKHGTKIRLTKRFLKDAAKRAVDGDPDKIARLPDYAAFGEGTVVDSEPFNYGTESGHCYLIVWADAEERWFHPAHLEQVKP